MKREHHSPTKRNTLINSEKYIGLDVHQATTSVAVLDHTGKLVMVTFEEGTSAAWLYDLLRPHVAHLVVCNPRKNALLKAGNKSDRIAQLSDHHQGSDPGDESSESLVSQLGDPLCRLVPENLFSRVTLSYGGKFMRRINA